MINDKTIDSIVEEFNNFKEEDPWDGDVVDDVCDYLKIRLNHHQGNITDIEYEEQLNKWKGESVL